MRNTMKYIVGAGTLAIFTIVAYAEEKRDCNDSEEGFADAQLAAIEKDTRWSKKLVEQHLPFGPHISSHVSQGGPTNEKLLVQAGYIIMHDGDLRTALWTAHRLTSEDVIQGESNRRVECFRRDKRIQKEHAAVKEDYEEPIFHRGHLTADRDLRDDFTEQLNSYVLSNIAPQYARFNTGIWLTLEELARDWAKTYDTVYVTSGALVDFNYRDKRDKDNKAARMGSNNQTARVAIASHFYKVFLRKCGNRWHTIAFLFDHHNGPNCGKDCRRLKESIMSLESIENSVEIMFHPNLDRANIRQSLDGEGWGLRSANMKDDADC